MHILVGNVGSISIFVFDLGLWPLAKSYGRNLVKKPFPEKNFLILNIMYLYISI